MLGRRSTSGVGSVSELTVWGPPVCSHPNEPVVFSVLGLLLLGIIFCCFCWCHSANVCLRCCPGCSICVPCFKHLHRAHKIRQARNLEAKGIEANPDHQPGFTGYDSTWIARGFGTAPLDGDEEWTPWGEKGGKVDRAVRLVGRKTCWPKRDTVYKSGDEIIDSDGSVTEYGTVKREEVQPKLEGEEVEPNTKKRA